MLAVKRRGRPVVQYKENSNKWRVQKKAIQTLLELAGSEEDALVLLKDILQKQDPAIITDSNKSLALKNKIRENIHDLFASLPSRSRVRPAILAKLTKGMTLHEASDLTGVSTFAVGYSRHTNLDADEILSRVNVRVCILVKQNAVSNLFIDITAHTTDSRKRRTVDSPLVASSCACEVWHYKRSHH